MADGESPVNLERALKQSDHCSRSQQRFLKPTSSDTLLLKSRRGVGGNTTISRCYIISQQHSDPSKLQLILDGWLSTAL